MNNSKTIRTLLLRIERMHELRSPMYDGGRGVRWAVGLVIGFVALSMAVNGWYMSGEIQHIIPHAHHAVDSALILILIFDFWTRYHLTHNAFNTDLNSRHYALLPIPRHLINRIQLWRDIKSSHNLFFGFFLVPFGIHDIWMRCGAIPLVGWLSGYWLLFVANAMLFRFVNTLSVQGKPAIYAVSFIHVMLLLATFVPETPLFEHHLIEFGNGFVLYKFSSFAIIVLLIMVLYVACDKAMQRITFESTSSARAVTRNTTLSVNFVNKGRLFTLLQFEIRMWLRNNHLRTTLISMVIGALTLALTVWLNNTYTAHSVQYFYCIYAFFILPTTLQSADMSHEANFADMFFVRPLCLYDLFHAVYIFNFLLLSTMFFLSMPFILSGAMDFELCFTYFMMGVGMILPCMMVMALSNREAASLTSKAEGSTRKAVKILTLLTTMIIPGATERFVSWCVGDGTAHVIIIVLAFAMICSQKIWITAICRRFIKNRYRNLDGYRDTRL